jgi:hypothetical protein
VAILDQHPRPGLAGMICFLHPKASHGVLIEYAQPERPPTPEPTPLGLGQNHTKRA